ncbi:MAG: arylsulfatase [Cyanobacteria bacterium SZAS LIN-2]|nr:arylsulfatase [Cyanobacteria bacterium SZAS LIN-3]MBS1994728.1 arylsulfatase [Cyanobacteria bacterium SZAS LIN-2]MBS2006934.1 arylsulfatase [Cyanobacteria bacterium SZAS TMP-1]
MDRTILPIPEPVIPHSTVLDARNAKAPPQFTVHAPKSAPNVLIILVDDMGFGQSSAFGGPVQMPNLEKLANTGLRYKNFHTTALCSPTRAALLNGRNHHVCNMGSITETATAFPGQTGKRPNSVAPLAEMLRLNGYATAAFGKSHETAVWEVSPSGPTDRWPTRSGFDKFYGFIGGEANQWAPTLYDGLTQIDPPRDPNYHLIPDMTSQAIKWMDFEKSLTPDKPFFIYFAPGGTHAPHHVPAEWIAKYKGKFDQGWDKLREETLARQKKLGMVPENAVLAPKPEAIKDWDKLSDDEKKLFAHQMEVFAAYGEFTDYNAGKLIDAIAEKGQLDNTLIFYIAGDNGASAEGGFNGLFNEMSYFNGVPETVQGILKHYDELGSANSYGHYAAGWAVAGDTPFTWTKQVASDYGGTMNGMAVHWPAGIKAKGELRGQFHHVIDIAPTVLEAAGLPEPKAVNGTVQTPLEGVSMLYTFDDPKAKDRHTTQYFEIFGNRSIYHDGWLAGSVHKAPWEMKPRATFENDKWELYDTTKDFSLTNDLSKSNPAKLKEMQALFIKEATKYRALPLDDRFLERLNPALVGRPELLEGRSSLDLFEGMTGMSENVFLNLKDHSGTIDANLQIPAGGAEGVLVAQAGKFGGWSFYLKEGKPVFTYNFLGDVEYTVASPKAVPAGAAKVKFDFAYDGGGPGKGGTGTIYINGEQVAQGRIEHTQAFCFSADEGADVGCDLGTAVSKSYQVPFKFTGKIDKITVAVKPQAPAQKAQSDEARHEGTVKKALSD